MSKKMVNNEIMGEYGIALVDATSEMAIVAVKNVVGLIKAGEAVTKGYSNMMPWVARCYYTNIVSEIEGIKSDNELILKATGCSKATASEMLKVAKAFYDVDGKLTDTIFAKIPYSGLVMMANLDEEERYAVMEALADKEVVRKKDVADAIDIVKAVDVTEESSTGEQDDQDQNDVDEQDQNDVDEQEDEMSDRDSANAIMAEQSDEISDLRAQLQELGEVYDIRTARIAELAKEALSADDYDKRKAALDNIIEICATPLVAG